jgi:membrane protein
MKKTMRMKMAELWRDFRALAQAVKAGGLDYRAMSLVYTSLLALIPLLAVSFSVLKAFGAQSQFEPLLLEILQPLGAQGETVAAGILDSVKKLKVGVLGGVGVLMLLYTSASMLNKIEESFNHIWHARASRNLARRLGDYVSFILIGPWLLILAFGGLSGVLSKPAPVNGIWSFLHDSLQSLAPDLFIIAAFSFAYRSIPNARVKTASALCGGVAAGLAWKAAGWAFAAFVASSAQYHAVYSSFAILVLFIIWLYVSWLIVLLGGQVAFFHQHPRYLLQAQGATRMGGAAFERAGLGLMFLIGRGFYRGEPPWRQEGLAERLALPEDCVEALLNLLREGGLIARMDAERGAYLPARDLAAIRQSDILDILRGQPAASVESGASAGAAAEAVMGRIDAALRGVLAERSLRDLVIESEQENSQ